MKIIKNVIATLILFSVISFAQQQTSEDIQRIKDALIISTIQVQDLAKKNQELALTIQRIADDLKATKTIEQLDSLKQVYGIPAETKEQNKK
jgi:alcohol dehydrogenase class IV